MNIIIKSTIKITIFLMASAGVFADEEVFLLSPHSASGSASSDFVASNSIAGLRLSALPPVYITKPADYFAIQLELINDSRLPEERSKEIHETVLGLIEASGNAGYTLQSGTERVDRSNFQIDTKSFPGKADTSFIHLLLKVDLKEGDVRSLSERLTKFVQSQEMEGRTYVIVTSSGLSIQNPQSYRHEILKEIANEIENIKALFSGEVVVSVTGLDGRVSVRQSNDRNIDLYIPYSFSFINTHGK